MQIDFIKTFLNKFIQILKKLPSYFRLFKVRIGKIYNSLLNFSITHSFEPKSITAEQFWIGGLRQDVEGRIEFIILKDFSGSNAIEVDKAFTRIEKYWLGLQDVVRKRIIIPVYCIHNVNPHFEGAKAILTPKLPIGVVKQIRSLRLQNPFDIRTQGSKGNTSVITRSIIDIQNDRILIVGNAKEISKTIRIICTRLAFGDNEIPTINKILLGNLKSKMNDPLGSSLLIGGFGAIFGFEAVYIINNLQLVGSPDLNGQLIACVLVFLNVLAFLTFEAFESKIVAFSPWWASKVKAVSWIIFLAMILLAPVVFFKTLRATVLLPVVQILGVSLIITNLITNMSQIFYAIGLQKWLAMFWWFVMLILILITPLIL